MTQSVIPESATPVPPGLTIEPIDLRTAPEADLAPLSEFWNRMRAERLPEDPPIPFAEHLQGWRHLPAFEEVAVWAAREADGRVVGAGEVYFQKTEENRHLVGFEVAVLPERRRGGLGKALLARVVEVPVREGRRLMITGTSDRVPAGEAVLARLGAEKGLEAHTNQLLVAELDRTLLRGWIETADERAGAYELGFWDGPYPEDRLEMICDLFFVMNTAPRGGLEIEDERVTPEQVRQWEARRQATGTRRWSTYVLERATGRFAGFTELFHNPNRPAVLNQGATGVFPEHRGRGLGRWLKAASLERVLAEVPGVTKVRTGNADSNGPMLGINHAMGFKPFMAQADWQVPTETVLTYLAR